MAVEHRTAGRSASSVSAKSRGAWPTWVQRAGLSVAVGVLALLLSGLPAQARGGAGRSTYVAERPGVFVKIAAMPRRVVAYRIQTRLRCSNGTRQPELLKDEVVTRTPIRADGHFLFHAGHADAITMIEGSVSGAEILGKFRYSDRLTPGNVRCGTGAPNGRWVRFAARRRRPR